MRSASFTPPIAQPGVVEAQIRRLAGFDIFETVILPENGEKLVGFASHPSGLAVAMRYLEPVAEYDEAGAVTDPDTGLTFGYLRYTETSSNRIFVTVECLDGWKQAIAGGIGDRIIDALLSFVNDQNAEAEAFFNQADARGIFWST